MKITRLTLLAAAAAVFCSAGTASATLQYVTNIVSGYDARYEQETNSEYDLTALRIAYSEGTGSVAAHAEHGLLAFEGRIAGRTDNLSPSGSLFTEGQVSFGDVLKIDVPGLAGQTGIVRIAYRIDGAIVLNGNTAFTNAGYFVATAIRSTAGGADDYARYTRRGDGTSEGEDALGTRREVTSRFVFGEDFDFGVGLNNLDARLTMQSEADASNSAALTIRYLVEGIVSVTDVNGNPITEFKIGSRSGREYGARALWSAGRDLLLNEKPDRESERVAVNQTVPEWSYGYRSTAEGTAFTLFTPEEHVKDETFTSEGWSTGQGHILVNVGSEPRSPSLGFGALKPLLPGQVLTHPSPTMFPVVRWTAPAAGRYNIVGRWLDLDNHGGNGISCHVVINGEMVFSEEVLNDGQADAPLQAVDLDAGDIVDFVVGARGDHTFDNTGFNAAISLAPAIEITVAGAENGKLTTTAGQDLAVTANVLFANAAQSVELRDNGRVVGRDDTAPYEFTIEEIESGQHRIQAVAFDNRGVEGASNELVVTAAQGGPASAARAGAKGETSDGKTATSGYTYFFNAQSGRWDDENNWFRLPDFNIGVPGPNDDAFITYFVEGSGGAVVTINRKIDVKTLTVGSENKLMAESGVPRFEAGVSARGAVYLSDATLEGFELAVGQGAEFTNNFDSRFINMAIFNNGDITYVGPGKTVADAVTEFKNNGAINIQRPPASNRGVEVNLPAVQHNGGLLAVQDGTKLLAGSVELNGQLKLGGGIISRDGAGLVGPDGGSLIGMDGASLIGADGASLVGPDGASLIGMDGASIISRDGAGFTKSAGKGEMTSRAEATSGSIVIGSGGIVTGRGNLVGDVVNQAGVVSPGSSADVIRILGNYTQEAAGTLLMEVGGTTANPPQFDQLQVRGTATLGGKLIVKTIDDFTPQSGDAFSPLSYDAVGGSFSSVSSNAQVTLGTDGMTMQVSGPNPPAPKALNIATRMRVETGDNVLIAGFIITGDQPKKVLVRGIGPSLPVAGTLADPILELDGGAVVNDDWRSDQQSEIEATTIPPTSDLESAIVATLDPGAHTAVLRGKAEGTGVGLVEVYDLESGTPVQLANISTRGQVQTGDNVMIGGFIIGGDYPAKVLLRAIGPSLTVEGALQDPTLELVDGNGATISNDDWRATQEAEIVATTVPPTNDREAAIVATLVPGAYTAIVRGKDDTVGVALVEGYNLQ